MGGGSSARQVGGRGIAQPAQAAASLSSRLSQAEPAIHQPLVGNSSAAEKPDKTLQVKQQQQQQSDS